MRPEAALLVAAVRGDARAPVVDLEDLAVAQTVLDAACAHRVLPALARYLTERDLAPAGWSGPLRQARQEQALRHLAVLAELRRVGPALESAGIDWLVAKGPVVASLWPVPEARQYYDVDLYVPRRSFLQAREVLTALGVVDVDRNWPVLARERRAEIALATKAGTHVDLHWHVAVLPELRQAFAVDFDAMVERRRHRDVGSGLRLPTFDPADTVLTLVFHAAQAGGDKLVWLGDVWFALHDPELDVDELARRVRAARFGRPFALVLERVHRVLGVAPGVLAALRGLGARPLVDLARRLDRRHPQPWLPGDDRAAGNLYAGVRPTTVASVRHVLAARRAERREAAAGTNTYGSVLWDDVPDAQAQRDYAAWVDSGAG